MRMTLLFALCALSGCDKLWTGFLSPCERTGYGCPDGYVPEGDGGVNDASMPDFSEPETDMAGGPPNFYSVSLDEYNTTDKVLLVGSNVSTMFVIGQPDSTPSMPRPSMALSSSVMTLRLIGVTAYGYNNNLLRLAVTDQGQIWESRAGANFQPIQGLPGSGALNGFASASLSLNGNERHTFAVGAGGRILHRRDTGTVLGTFLNEGITGNNSYLRGVSARVEKEALMMGPQNDMGYDMARSDFLSAWAVGEGGALLERGESGTWSVVPDTVMFQKPTFALYGVDAALYNDRAFVWAVGHGNTVVNKVDGGWATYTIPGPQAELYAVSVASSLRAIAVGANSKIYMWSRTTLQWQERTVMVDGGGSLPSVKLRAIYHPPGATDDGPYYIVGEGGVVLRYYGYPGNVMDNAELLSYR